MKTILWFVIAGSSISSILFAESIVETRTLRCSFETPSREIHTLVADIDPDNKLYSTFKYIIGDENSKNARVLPFSSAYVKEFRYDGAHLEINADTKSKDGAIVGYIGPKSDSKNSLKWEAPNGRFEFQPDIEGCKVTQPLSLEACQKRRKKLADKYFAAAKAYLDMCEKVERDGGIFTQCPVSHPGLKVGWEMCK
jgi:hypothetical protein